MTGAPLTAFYAAMSQHGIVYHGAVHTDDKLHRFKAEGDHNENSWYALRVRDGICVGGFGCWKRDVVKGWCSEKNLTPEQRRAQDEALRDFRERDRKEREEKQAKARAYLAEHFRRWPKVDSHPYLENKKLKPAGDVRLCQNDSYNGWLAVPIFDANGVLQSAQYIAPDSTKRFQFGGLIQGCMFPVLTVDSGPAIICEGYATGLSIAAATGWTTVCAFNCGNLLAVAKLLRKTFPDRLLIVAGDDDHVQTCRACDADIDLDLHPTICPSCSKEHGQINSGVVKGKAAAEAVKGIFVKPQFSKH